MKTTLLILFLSICCTPVFSQKYKQAYQAGNYEKAIKYAEKAIDANSKDLEAYLTKAMCNLHLGTDSLTKSEHSFGVESAFSSLKLIIKKDKTGEFIKMHQPEVDSIIYANYKIAEASIDNNKLDKAEKIINDLIAIQPKPAYYFLVGQMWLNEGNDFKAIAMFNDAAAKIYLDNKAGIQPEPYLFEIFQVLAENIAGKGDYNSAYTIYNRALILFEDKDIDEAYLNFLSYIADGTFGYNDSAKQMGFIKNLDTIDAFLDEPKIIANLKWKMLYAYYGSHSPGDYYGTASVLEDYSCREKNDSTLLFFYDKIFDATLVETTIDGLLPSDGRRFMRSWLNLQTCLNNRDITTALYGEMDKLLAEKKYIPAYEWLYNMKIQKVDAKKITEYENKYYALIKDADTSQFSFMDLYELTTFFPQNKNFKALQDKGAYAEIIRLIDSKQFSAAGKILRKQIRVSPKDKTLNDLYRLWVIRDYQENYVGSAFYIGRDEWGGSEESCTPGKLSPEIQKQFLQRLNYVRRVAGVPDNCVLRDSWNQYCQATALLMSANGDLSHFPPTTWNCYTKEGAIGANNSNLSLGYSCVDALMGQLDDSGDNNYFVGHRRWILNPARKVFGHGSTSYAMALWALGGENSDYDPAIVKEFETQYVCWPPEFYFPSVLNTARWSFSLRGADFSKAEIEMYSGNNKIEVKVLEFSPGYGLSTVVWEPQGSFYKYDQDNSYKIVVKNVGIGRWDLETQEYVYDYKTFTYYTTMVF